MSQTRRILVRISPTGETTVEAEGFRGNGCEAATQAIEKALGTPRQRTRKPDFWRAAITQPTRQTLGDPTP